MNERSARALPMRRFFVTAGIGVLLFTLAGSYAFLHAGLWLVREDPLQKSLAVVVLSGGLPDRAFAAAQNYRDGLAREVLVTQPLQPRAYIEDLHLPYAPVAQYH